ncbi:hypothetical protein MAUB_21190 [Mycolicibacterium aubagnense]|uniref:Major facilitator superfamily (MFS) profile domain-containing protein n=1 Tax=Mycolicibacterium aubagnense TaxID=319707 RepID=A0ABM7IBZ1_9MYCO|nr:hypothetical protein MAUB_21190 [Mycolicibacterium aubagnense]
MAAATFLIFFQAFMVAPLIPQLAHEFGSSTDLLGLAVPAYLVPYGAMTLLWGPLSDRIGRKRVILGSAAGFVVLTALTALADGPRMFIAFRLLTALGASGVVPISLALIGDVFPYERRGHALGWLFGAMAGGMAFGSSAGALLEPLIGWQGLFLGWPGSPRSCLWHLRFGARSCRVGPRCSVEASGRSRAATSRCCANSVPAAPTAMS